MGDGGNDECVTETAGTVQYDYRLLATGDTVHVPVPSEVYSSQDR
jgi:hypothetical protein